MSAPTRRNPTDEDAEAIHRCHGQGLSQTRTAEELGLDRRSLGRWSKRNGLQWGPPPQPATHIAHERMREARNALAAEAISDARYVRRRLWEPSVVIVATRDGVERIELPEPTAREVADIAAAVERLAKVADHHTTEDATVAARAMLTTLARQLAAVVETEEEDQ